MNTSKNIVLVPGKFRVIHSGHIRLFRAALELGDELVVALDVEGTTPEEIAWRTQALNSFGLVSLVVEYENDISQLLRRIKPARVLKGYEHSSKFNLETEVLTEYGGELLFSSGSEFSQESDFFLSEDEEILNLQKSVSLPIDFLTRNSMSREQLVHLLDKFDDIQVCVIGDLIVDEYISCRAIGMSQEEPTIVVTPVDSRRFLGGAGIVAAHCASLGAKTHLITVTGEDSLADWATHKAASYGLDILSVRDAKRPTTLKQRFRSGTQSLLRVSHLSQEYLDDRKKQQIIDAYKSISSRIDLLIFADFSYGVISADTARQLIEIARENQTIVAADSQSSSQVGKLSKFIGADLVSATEHEARLEMQEKNLGLVALAEELSSLLKAENLILKLGKAGVLLVGNEASQSKLPTEEIVSFNDHATDVSGAGDSMLAAASLALAAGGNIYEVGFIGSLSASIQVGRTGNLPISSGLMKRILLK